VVNGYTYLGLKFGNLRRMEVINGKYEIKRHTEIKSSKQMCNEVPNIKVKVLQTHMRLYVAKAVIWS
jgi:hypothetical protein